MWHLTTTNTKHTITTKTNIMSVKLNVAGKWQRNPIQPRASCSLDHSISCMPFLYFLHYLQDHQTSSRICWMSEARTSCMLEITYLETSSNQKNVKAGRPFWLYLSSPRSCKCGRKGKVSSFFI